ncbi:hypothetical protein EIP91_007649 [Steccherinum ochraceum]|uniref:Uncharacterized protein n=1 Tax=Steccherinum ochraceum TaxID=92696 RepID=A0A4R0R9P5_9APHY|nr:hypothetical protein EIP91_007649 [Steccherinum ochraceum]
MPYRNVVASHQAQFRSIVSLAAANPSDIAAIAGSKYPFAVNRVKRDDAIKACTYRRRSSRAMSVGKLIFRDRAYQFSSPLLRVHCPSVGPPNPLSIFLTEEGDEKVSVPLKATPLSRCARYPRIPVQDLTLEGAELTQPLVNPW